MTFFCFFSSISYKKKNCIFFDLQIAGFLNLGLKECSGNQGIKDIILSLRWIKDNISSFGGDPDNVTLLGSSSGATSVHILMLSPAAKGIFIENIGVPLTYILFFNKNILSESLQLLPTKLHIFNDHLTSNPTTKVHQLFIWSNSHFLSPWEGF